MWFLPLRGLRFALLALMALFIVLCPVRAMAYDCNALVVDDAGALGSDIVRVQAAAQKIENAGAYMRVRTVTNFGGFADLDRYEADYEAHCQAWQDMNGGTKSNLLVFAVSFGETKPQSGAGLYYGDLWKKALDAQWNGVLVDEVVPRLGDGDSAAALEAGLNGFGEIIAATKAARTATTSSSAPVVIVQQPSAPSQPMDLSGLWWVMGLGLLAVIGVLIVYALLAAMRRAEERREAQQKARLAMQACVNYVTSAEQTFVLAMAKVDGQRDTFAQADLKPMQDTLAKARRNLMAAQTQYGELQAADANPDQTGLTASEYRNLEGRYDELRATFRHAVAFVSDVDVKISELTALAASAEESLNAASAAIEAAGARVSAVEKAGFRVGHETLDAAVAALGNAEAAKNSKSFGQMRDELVRANTLAPQAADEAEALQRGKTEIDASIAAARGEGTRVDQLMDRAGGVFREIAAVYAPESWSNVNGNGSQAEQMIQDAGVALEASEAAASMEVQDWDAARAQLDSATGNIKRAESLAEAIIALKRDLDAAKAAVPKEIEDAAADIVTAREYIAHHDADVDDELEAQLDEAERSLNEARSELVKDKPNYLAVVKTARAINSTADGILAKAQGEHEVAERMRQRAVTAMREADRSVDAADQYIRSHRSEVDSDAERLLEQARAACAKAQDARTVEVQIRHADQADKDADTALDMARRDVREREEEREREARRQREAAAALIRASHRSSSGGFGGGGGRGGGSIGFGGGGGRSGGSVSSGGRGGRSGGSVGW